MVRTIAALALCWGLFLCTLSSAQTTMNDSATIPDSGAVGLLPPDIRPKIQALARILQENLADGTLSDSRIQRELQNGNLPGVIQGLGPDAGRLLEEIKASFQANHSEESLMIMLQLLVGATQGSGVVQSDESVR